MKISVLASQFECFWWISQWYFLWTHLITVVCEINRIFNIQFVYYACHLYQAYNSFVQCFRLRFVLVSTPEIFIIVNIQTCVDCFPIWHYSIDLNYHWKCAVVTWFVSSLQFFAFVVCKYNTCAILVLVKLELSVHYGSTFFHTLIRTFTLAHHTTNNIIAPVYPW